MTTEDAGQGTEPLPAKVGTCSVCGQELIVWDGACWHPHTIERACPSGMSPGFDKFVERSDD